MVENTQKLFVLEEKGIQHVKLSLINFHKILMM